MRHRHVWHLTAIYFAATIRHYTITFWMPQLIKHISSAYSNTAVGVLVMIPYLAALGAMILGGQSSDKRLERYYHAAVPLIIAAISLVLLSRMSRGSVFFSVVLWSLAASGINCLWGPFWSLPNAFLTGFSAAAGIAFIHSIGNLGGFLGPYATGLINGRTNSFRGGLLFAGLSLFASAVLILVLRRRMVQQTMLRDSEQQQYD
jgi:MFS transporter, ACS family, tartrate transporter